ncbi:MAG: hypothetical protein KDB14_20135 [Planctomycetales bacterium]|nr:hypothetical protein [Planctomycetales bacterium]
MSDSPATPPSDVPPPQPTGGAELARTSTGSPAPEARLVEGELRFRDFVPHQLSGFGVFKVAEYETFDAVVAAANQWLQESHVALVQLETVVLPNIWSKYEEGTTDGSLGSTPGATSHWHQFLRVWYRNLKPHAEVDPA